jgi:hypothetical protein
MIFIAQGSIVVVGFLLIVALGATLASLLSIGLSFCSVRRRWYVPLLAFPSFVFGVALTVMWFTHSGEGLAFPVITVANILFSIVGIGRWVFNQAR